VPSLGLLLAANVASVPPTMTITTLDRFMHRCSLLEFEGKSSRLKEAAARIALSPEAP